MSTPKVSVAMATYNGASYVQEQLASILDQLSPSDEVIVVDDASPDDTAEIVERIAAADSRVRLVRSPVNRGYVRTFEAAIGLALGDAVLLSDQDDRWRPGRVEAMREALSERAVVATNLATLGGGESLGGPLGQDDWLLRAVDSDRSLRNVFGILAGNRPYYGCAMGLRRDVLAIALPFPRYLTESHDLWLALVGNLSHSMRHLELRSLERRLHGDNQTPARPRGPGAVLRSRLMLLRAILTIRARMRALRRSD